MFLVKNFTIALADVLGGLLTLYFWIVLIAVLITWVRPDPYNPIVRFLRAATEPVFFQVRRLMPFVVLGNIDLSPIVVLLGVRFLGSFVVRSLYDLAATLGSQGPPILG